LDFKVCKTLAGVLEILRWFASKRRNDSLRYQKKLQKNFPFDLGNISEYL